MLNKNCEASKEREQSEKAFCQFCTWEAGEPESKDKNLHLNGSLSAENKPSTILFIKQFRRFALNRFHSNPGL